LYRVYYKDNKQPNEPLAVTPANEASQARKLRHDLEQFHGVTSDKAVDAAWPNLKNKDRFIRYAARVAIQSQPVSQWQEKALTEKDPQILTQAIIALARYGDKSLESRMLKSLMTVSYKQLPSTQQIDFLRAVELTLFRMGLPEAAQNTQLIAYLGPNYPAANNELNRLFSKILATIGDPQVVPKTLALVATAKDNDSLQKTFSNSNDLIMR
ncbi:MAG: heme-binding protein, partial [Chitinophagaceae bacterium]